MVMGTMLLFAGCSKETVAPQAAATATEAGTPKYATRVFYSQIQDDGSKIYGCDAHGGNCLDDVVVTPKLVAPVNNVFAALASNDRTTIAQAFSTNATALNTLGLPAAQINQVVAGTLLAEGGHDAAFTTRYIIIKDLSNVVVNVYPFK